MCGPSRASLGLAVLPLAGAAALAIGAMRCSSKASDVCTDVGNCARGGSSDWIQACEAETKLLKDETAKNGCGAPFDAYYACAGTSFVCAGVSPTFPGCEAQRVALDGCLASRDAGTGCARLAAAESSCVTSAGVDASTDAGPPPACDLALDCEARCYVESVANPCAPAPDELDAATRCTSTCPL